MHQAAVVHRIGPGWPRPSTNHDNYSYRGCYNPGKLPQTPADAALVPAASGGRGERAAPTPGPSAGSTPGSPAARLAAYLAELFEAGRAASSAVRYAAAVASRDGAVSRYMR